MAYEEDVKARALTQLAANGGNVSKTSRELGVPQTTVRLWRDGGVSARVAENCEQKKIALADQLEDIVRTALGILPEKLPGASVHEINGTVKIAAETMQLLRGSPTSIQETRQQDLSPDERADRIESLLDQGRNRRSLAVSDGGGTGGDRPAPAVH